MKKLDILEVLKKGFDVLANYPILLGFTAFGIVNFILSRQKELGFLFWVAMIFQVLLSAYLGAFIIRFIFDSTYKNPSWQEVN